MEKNTLEKIKKELVEEKARIEKELSRFAQPTDVPGNYETEFENIGRDRDDNAHEVEDYQGNIALEKTLEDRLQAILAALERIDKGTYGKCTNCGEDISSERLEASHEAILCMKCA